MGNGLSGSAAFKASMRPRTASSSAGFVGPRFEPLEAVPLFGIGDVAERRPQKYFGSWKDWPISADPTGLPSRMTRLPDTCLGKTALPPPLLVLTDTSMQTVNVGLHQLSVGISQNVLIAALAIASVPTIVFFLIFQRNIMAGLTAGGMKG